ncbi:MAG: hypothetical protein JWM27_1897 [Gemmatimonadetes bacterium]|nr:hypothetical protein [Gemmatimonadota bacterium]
MPRPTPAIQQTRTTAVAAPEAEAEVRFSVQNLALLAAGLFTIVLGYVLLSQGSIVAAPLLLVLGYTVLIPLGIIR